MRGAQLARQWKIIRMAESRRKGVTATELAVELGVPLRTVYRDLDAIHEAGFPIYPEKLNRASHWKLVDAFKKDFPLPLTVTELMSLHMSRSLLSIFEGTIFHDSIEGLFNKVKAVLSPETLRYLENISGRLKVQFGPCKDFAGFREVIQSISEATAKRRRVEIRYAAVSSQKETLRKVDPYQVWAMNGCLYLIGLCHLRNEIRTFAMDRIRSFQVLNESFHFPKDFSLEKYVQTAFHVMKGKPECVKVRFSPEVAHIVRERFWHPTQEIRELEDGALELCLKVPINYEIISWVLGFGSAAEVIEPDSLRTRMVDELRAATLRYEKSSVTNGAFTKKIHRF